MTIKKKPVKKSSPKKKSIVKTVVTKEPDSTGPCFGCGLPTTEDFYCYGCKAFICSGCDEQEQIGFNHGPNDHFCK